MVKLTEEQIKEVQNEQVQDGVPVRFQINGQTLNIVTGDLQARGINVMYQIVYWNFTKETSQKIANWLGAKAIFSEE